MTVETYSQTEDRLKARALRLRWVEHARRDFPDVVTSTTGTDLYCSTCGRYLLSHPTTTCEDD